MWRLSGANVWFVHGNQEQFSSSNNWVSSCCTVDFLQMVLSLSLAARRILFDFAANWRAPWKDRTCSTTTKLEKITRKASDAAENLKLYRVVWLFHPRSSCTSADVQRITLNASSFMTISGGRTERYNRFSRAGCSRLEYVDIRSVY